MSFLSYVINLPAKLGRAASAGSVSVTLASDDTAISALNAIEASAAASATAANQAAANASLATIATAQGAGGTGIAEPTGGSGLLGWLSGIYQAILSVLSVYTKNVQVAGNLTVADPTGTTAGSTVTINTDSLGSLGIRISGNGVGTVLFQGTVDGVAWDNPKAYPLTVGSAGVQSTTAPGDFEVNCAAFKQFRVCMSALTSGSFAVAFNGTAAVKHVGVKNGNPADLQVTITPAGAALTDRSSVVNSSVTGASVAAGGSGGTNGTQTVTGTTGTGTKFQASVTVASGAITAVLSITIAGAYSVLPTNPAAEPVTGAGLTGATLNLTMATIPTQLAAANPARKGWRVQNTSAADQWFNDTGGNASIGGAGCFKVASFGYYETPVGGASQAAVSIYGATSGQSFSASEW